MRNPKERPLTAQRKISRKSTSRGIDLKKSVNLLQAYGEYDRFLQVSKEFLKSKGLLTKPLKRKKKNNIKSRDINSTERKMEE